MDAGIEKEGTQVDEGLGWGKSAQVPSVQEIVRKDCRSVPERYIRELEERPGETKLFSTSFDVPVVDLSLLINNDEDECKKLHFACKEFGFFQVINHGVEEEVSKNMKAVMAAFFELPFEVKMKYAMAQNDVQGYGQAFVASERQKLEWCDFMFLISLPAKFKNMKYWPLAVPNFREAIEQYSSAIYKVTEEILAHLSLLMDLDRDALKQMHGEMKQGIRMNYYPTCSRPDLVLGVSPHSDGRSITILLQDDDITGLQIRHKGKWLPIKPIPNSLVVNVGDVMEGWSNGLYESIEHRAVTNETTARMSIATFVIPGDEADTGPVSTMMEGRPRKYKSVEYLDYLRHMFSRKLDAKSNTEFLKVGIEDH